MAKDHMCVSLVPLFNHLDETDQRVIHMLVTHHIKEKGELIFTPTSADQLVIVARGSLKVYQLSANGKEQVLRVIEPGGYLVFETNYCLEKRWRKQKFVFSNSEILRSCCWITPS